MVACVTDPDTIQPNRSLEISNERGGGGLGLKLDWCAAQEMVGVSSTSCLPGKFSLSLAHKGSRRATCFSTMLLSSKCTPL